MCDSACPWLLLEHRDISVTIRYPHASNTRASSCNHSKTNLNINRWRSFSQKLPFTLAVLSGWSTVDSRSSPRDGASSVMFIFSCFLLSSVINHCQFNASFTLTWLYLAAKLLESYRMNWCFFSISLFQWPIQLKFQTLLLSSSIVFTFLFSFTFKTIKINPAPMSSLRFFSHCCGGRRRIRSSAQSSCWSLWITTSLVVFHVLSSIPSVQSPSWTSFSSLDVTIAQTFLVAYSIRMH